MTVTRYWFTISQAADIARISEDAVRTEIRENHLHPRRLGVTALIVDAELDRWLRVRFPSHRSTGRPAKQLRPPSQLSATPPSDQILTRLQSPAGDGSVDAEDFSIDAWLQDTGSRSTGRR